jgi:hypothetical protein
MRWPRIITITVKKHQKVTRLASYSSIYTCCPSLPSRKSATPPIHLIIQNSKHPQANECMGSVCTKRSGIDHLMTNSSIPLPCELPSNHKRCSQTLINSCPTNKKEKDALFVSKARCCLLGLSEDTAGEVALAEVVLNRALLSGSTLGESGRATERSSKR